MSDRTRGPAKSRQQSAIAMAALLAAMVATDVTWAQAAAQPVPALQSPSAASAPAPQSEPAPRPDPVPRENPGLLNEIGKLLEKPASMLPALKSPKETIDDAAGAISRLTKSPGVKGRVACPVAPNGAPDCKAAADKLCQHNGFKEGRSLDVDTTRNCSAKALLSGRKPDESECRTDNYVTRALCQ
ncbi:hypothetical protein [uncultured Bradyrhizobium sp.]|uniref:hypothetical protein n=1 Tax=uncultured Bradyrhizobium sp. TaxID=199684 RepID=UPI0035CA5479